MQTLNDVTVKETNYAEETWRDEQTLVKDFETKDDESEKYLN